MPESGWNPIGKALVQQNTRNYMYKEATTETKYIHFKVLSATGRKEAQPCWYAFSALSLGYINAGCPIVFFGRLG